MMLVQKQYPYCPCTFTSLHHDSHNVSRDSDHGKTRRSEEVTMLTTMESSDLGRVPRHMKCDIIT